MQLPGTALIYRAELEKSEMSLKCIWLNTFWHELKNKNWHLPKIVQFEWKTLLKNIYKWNSCRGGDQPVSPYVHCTNKNVTVLKFWPEILCFEVAQRASIVFLNTLFILNSSAILLHKILNFEFSTLEPKNIVVGNFPPIGNPRQQIVWLVRSFIIFQRMINQTNLT